MPWYRHRRHHRRKTGWSAPSERKVDWHVAIPVALLFTLLALAFCRC